MGGIASTWKRTVTGWTVAAVAVTVPGIRVTATRPCPPAADPEQFIPFVHRLRTTPGGVWLAGGGGSEDVVTPVLFGTADNGSTWAVHCLSDAGEMRSVFFLDEKTGWAGGSGQPGSARLLMTKDGGRTWLAGRVPADVAGVEDVTFVDPLHGWAVGPLRGAESGPGLIRSSDGGATWSRAPVPPEFELLHRVQFLDRRHGWIIGGNRIGATADGGRTWALSALPGSGDPTPTDITFTNPSEGWVVGHVVRDRGHRAGEIFASSDGGRSWERRGAVPGIVTSISADDQGLVVTGRWPGQAARSVDGGRNWADLPVPPESGPIAAGDGPAMWASVQNGERAGCVYRTTDAGRRWVGHSPFGTADCPPVVARP